MLWLLIILLVLFLLVMYVLFAPLRIEIDSRIGLCKFSFGRMVRASVSIQNDIPLIELNILGFNKSIPLISQHSPAAQTVTIEKKKTKKNIRKKRNALSLKQMIAVLKSFKIKKFYLTLSFSDMPANGILYPLFWWIKTRTGMNMEINFIGENQFVFYAHNNAFRLIRAYLKSYKPQI